jgi:hypothetical protein
MSRVRGVSTITKTAGTQKLLDTHGPGVDQDAHRARLQIQPAQSAIVPRPVSSFSPLRNVRQGQHPTAHAPSGTGPLASITSRIRSWSTAGHSGTSTAKRIWWSWHGWRRRRRAAAQSRSARHFASSTFIFPRIRLPIRCGALSASTVCTYFLLLFPLHLHLSRGVFLATRSLHHNRHRHDAGAVGAGGARQPGRPLVEQIPSRQ